MRKVIGRILIGSMVIVMGTSVVFSEPGSEKDPLVSISYVDKKIAEVKNYIDEKISKNENGNTESSSQLEIVDVKKGQALIGEMGTEIILRGGEATSIASELGGLSDLTEGKDLPMGTSIKSNHLILVPRSDQRGVYAITDAIFIVRGSYIVR